MDPQASSDEEDVFECGRCRERFTSLEGFMEHKNTRVCRKPKHESLQTVESKENVASAAAAFVAESDLQGAESKELSDVFQRKEAADHGTLDFSPGDNIIMAASIASGIDDLAAVAGIECNRQDQLKSKQGESDITPLAAPQENTTMQQNSQQNEEDIVSPAASQEDSNTPDSENLLEKATNEGQSGEENASEIVEISLAAFNFKCIFCSSAFTNHADLREHFAATHRISDEQINKLIQEVEKTIQKKKTPVKKSPGRPRGRKRLPTDCALCCKIFTTRKNFLKHNKSKHHLARLQQQHVADTQGKRLKKCSHCIFSASNGKELTDHINKEHSFFAGEAESEQVVPKKRGRGRPRKIKPERIYDEGNDIEPCSECGKEMKKKLLIVHIKRCQNKNTLAKCSECGKAVVKKALYRHQRRCLNKKHLVCPLCQHQSRERYDFTVHVNNHKTWLPAEPGDLPPKQEEPAAVIEREQPDDTDKEAQDLAGQSAGGDDKEQVESGETQDKISTLDLSVLGLTPTPTAPLVIQDQNDVTRQLGGNEDPQVANQHPVDGEEKTSMDTSKTNQASSISNYATGQGELEVQRNIKQKQLKCHSCDNWYMRANFKHHMFAVHNLVKKFKCRVDICAIALTTVEDFITHVKSHGDHPPFVCGCRSCLIRNANTDNPEYINMLKKQKLKQYYQGMIYKCNKCWVKFPSAEGLERHNRKETHSHPCPDCGKVQVSKRQLRMHAVTHADERNYLCEECGASFKTKRDLNKHHMSHSEFKPFICQECGKGFLFKNKLVRHRMTVHSNEKPFKCTVQNCDKAFSRRDKLNDHARTHLYYEPFHCRFCPKGFFRKDNLKDHEVLHTKDYRFKCDRCPKGFMRPKLLARHIAHEHSLPDYDENNAEGINQVGQQLVPLKLTKPKSKSRSKSSKKSPSTEAQAQNLTSQITYMIYQQAGSSMAAALQQAMQSVNAGADGCPVSLPPEVLQAYHISQHTKDQPQTYQVTPVVGAEEQISPDSLQDRTEFRLT